MSPRLSQKQPMIAALSIAGLAFVSLSIPWWYAAQDLSGHGSYGVLFAAVFVSAAGVLVRWFARAGRWRV